MEKKLVSNYYKELIANNQLKYDVEQLDVLSALDILVEKILLGKTYSWLKGFLKIRSSITKGVYIYGSVGRGKSVIMDIFIKAIEKKIPGKTYKRIHFHSFMLETHKSLKDCRLSGSKDPLRDVAKKFRSQTDIFCFDEFEILDIADAMILGRFFKLLINSGTIIITTGNSKPNDLYFNGLQRVRFLPFIDFVYKNMKVIKIGGQHDYRVNSKEDLYGKRYYQPLGLISTERLNSFFYKLTNGKKPKTCKLLVSGRDINFNITSNKVVLTDFNDLCHNPYAASEYIEIAKNFNWVLIDKVPVLDASKRNEIRRFIQLIDILYEERIGLGMVGALDPKHLCKADNLKFSFKRAASRIEEMCYPKWKELY